MRISFFSDLHIQNENDFSSDLFEKFCNNEAVKNSTHVFLLGDMFDILIGEHKAYLDTYHRFFSLLLRLLAEGKNLVYLEGNHDFHVGKTLTEYVKNNSEYEKNFSYLKEGKRVTLKQKTYYFCHGYEVDYNNNAFKRWKNIYTSRACEFLVSKLMPYSLIKIIGEKAAGDSKKRGKRHFNLEEARIKYIAGAKSFIDDKKIDGVICGHTHIQESYTYPDGTEYYNCGFPLKNKNFLYYSDDDGFKFISLEES